MGKARQVSAQSPMPCGVVAWTDPVAFVRALVAGALLAVALIVALASHSAWESHQQHRDLALSRAQNIAQVLDQYVAGVFDKTDIALKAAAFEYGSRMGPAATDAGAVSKMLSRYLVYLPEVESLRIATADGIIRFGAEGPLHVDISDREHFRRALAGGDALVISEPLTGRVNGKSLIVLTRRIHRADGSFAGVVLASMTAAHYRRTFAALDLGAQGVIALRTTGLRLVARHPEPADAQAAFGSNKVPPQLVEALRTAPDEGVYAALGALDGVDRVNAYRRVNRYPYYVIVGIATQTWRESAVSDILDFAVLGGAAIAVVLLLSWLLYREWRHREGALSAMARESARNLLLLRNASDGIHIVDAAGKVLEASDSYCTMLGRGREQVLGSHLGDWDLRWSKAELDALLRGLLQQTGGSVVETRQQRPDGGARDIEISVTPVSYDGQPALFCSARDITDRKAAEQALAVSENRLMLATEASELGIWDLDLASGRAWRSAHHSRIFGHAAAADDWSFDRLLEHVLPEDRPHLLRETEQAKTRGQFNLEFRIRRSDGELRWIAVRGRVFRDAGGVPARMVGTVMDITDRMHQDETLRLQETIINTMGEGVCLVQASSRNIIYANPTFEHLFGYGHDELVGRPVSLLNAPAGQSPEDVAAGIIAVLAQRGAWAGDVQNIRKNGERFWCHATVTTVQHREHGAMWVAVHQDITARKRAELELQRLYATMEDQSNRDALTGLFNRRYLDESVMRELAKADRGGYPVSFIMMDIDAFKQLNDSRGHQAGDRVLQALGALLRDSTRGGDIACRYGGEEFLLVLPNVTLVLAVQRAEQLRAAVATLQVPWPGETLTLTVSSGVATYPDHGRTGQAVIACADAALYSAKGGGRNRVIAAGPDAPA